MAENYPLDATLLALTTDTDTGIEYVAQATSNYFLNWQKMMSRAILAFTRANDLRVYDAGGLNIGVRAGKFWDGTTLRTYAGTSSTACAASKAAIYVYINSAGTLVVNEYTAWPDASSLHMRLAVVVTDGSDITSITDARDHHMWYTPGMGLDEPQFYSDEAGASVSIVSAYWESASPADADAMNLSFYGDDDGANKTEYGRLTLTIDDVTDTTEDATWSFSEMVAGSLTSAGNLVGTTKSQALTNKTIDCDSNTVSNIDAAETGTYTAAGGGMPFILSIDITGGEDDKIFDANAPFKFRVLDAWSVAISADGGTWQLENGTDPITDAVTVTGTIDTIDRAGTIDEDYHEIAANGTLNVDCDGANADVRIYVLCMRVA